MFLSHPWRDLPSLAMLGAAPPPGGAPAAAAPKGRAERLAGHMRVNEIKMEHVSSHAGTALPMVISQTLVRISVPCPLSRVMLVGASIVDFAGGAAAGAAMVIVGRRPGACERLHRLRGSMYAPKL